MINPPISFDRATGAMDGANLLERGVSLALIAGSKIGALFAHRGYNSCANLIRRFLPERDIDVLLGPDATFSFPFSDGYWSKLLNRTFEYENELELVLLNSAGVNYTLIDCGANYGYWSVLASSIRFGSHRALAIEPSPRNFRRLAHNARINGNRFEVLNAAVGGSRGTAILSGNRHEAFSIVGEAAASGDPVEVLPLDDMVEQFGLGRSEKFIVKLDVEGVEIEAVKGGKGLLARDTLVVYEEHGNDPSHTVTRYILEQTPMMAIVNEPGTTQFRQLTQLSQLDRIKVASNVGYNVFATASPFWQQRLLGAATSSI